MKIPIVNENDEIIDYKERNDRDVDTIYRVSSLWIKNSHNDILLARRAWTKSHDPGKWGPAVAGTVEEGETYESNIVKEAEEELGIKEIKLTSGSKERRRTKWNYFVQHFNAILDKEISELTINKNEVAEVKWFSPKELREELNKHPDDFLSGIHIYFTMIKNSNLGKEENL